MGRGGDSEVLLAPERRQYTGELRKNFLENENDRILFDPFSAPTWMLDGELTRTGMSGRLRLQGELADEMIEEGLYPDVVAVILDTAELFRFDLEKAAGKHDTEIMPFLDLKKESQREWVARARAAYIALAKQSFGRPLAEVDDPTLMKDQGYFAVDDIRKIRGIDYSPQPDPSKLQGLSGGNHPTYTVPEEDRDPENPYMIMTDGEEWVPFDIDLAVRDAQKVIDREVDYDDLSPEEQENLDILIRDMILVNKRPDKAVEGNHWRFRDAQDGGYIHKFTDPLNRLHNTHGPAIVHFDEDGQVEYRQYFEDGRELRDGRPCSTYADGAKEYWVGTWREGGVEVGEDDFITNSYRIDYPDGSQEWWTGDGMMSRKRYANGQEEFNDPQIPLEDIKYTKDPEDHLSERRAMLRALEYKPDEIDVILEAQDGEELLEKLGEYRRSEDYRKARAAEKRAGPKKEEGNQRAKKKIDSLLFS